jgi:hypothetical protein
MEVVMKILTIAIMVFAQLAFANEVSKLNAIQYFGSYIEDGRVSSQPELCELTITRNQGVLKNLYFGTQFLNVSGYASVINLPQVSVLEEGKIYRTVRKEEIVEAIYEKGWLKITRTEQFYLDEYTFLWADKVLLETSPDLQHIKQMRVTGNRQSDQMIQFPYPHLESNRLDLNCGF